MAPLRNNAIAVGLTLSTLVGPSCTNDTDGAGFCDMAQSVRDSNTMVAEGLVNSEPPWPERRDDVERHLSQLHDALSDAGEAADGQLADDLRLWHTDTSALRESIGTSGSADEWLYGENANRPAPEELNPALDRIDAAFRERCDISARPS